MLDLQFVVTLVRQEGDIKNDGAQVCGSFSTKQFAQCALENLFHKCCNNLGIEELNAYSFQDLNEFVLTDRPENPNYHYYGQVHEVITDNEYDLFGDEPNGGTKYKQVPSLADLIVAIEHHIEKGIEPVEVIVQLNGGAYSRKTITLADDGESFEILNLIDDTTQILTTEELFDSTKSNIGKALQAGALYYVLD